MYSRLCLFLLILLICTIVQAQEPENIILNGDFETQFTSWLFWTEGGAVAERFIENKNVEPVDGESVAYVRIDNKGAGGGGNQVQFYQGPFVLKKGKKYTTCAWMMGGEGGEQVSMLVLKHVDPWTNYGSKAITLGTEWSEFSFTFTQPADEPSTRIDLFLGTAEGDIWIDHVRLYEGDYFDDGIREKPDKSVEPQSKLSVTWGKIKLGTLHLK